MGVYECSICGTMTFMDPRTKFCPKCGSADLNKIQLKSKQGPLYLRLDQAFEMLNVCNNMKETLAIRYIVFNGLSPMELGNARIEHLDPVDCILFLPHVHWKINQTKHIDSETVKFQIIYSGDRKKGPLLRSRKTGGHLTEWALWAMIKRIALRTNIPGKEFIDPLVLKRTFARIFLKTEGNTLLDLQRAFCHKHIWSTGHYLRCCLDDVKIAKNRMMDRVAKEIQKKVNV